MSQPSIELGTDMKKIALFVRTNRVKRKMTQTQLAEKVMTTQQLISIIETGKASPQLLIEYGHVFRALSNILSFGYEAESPEFEVWRKLVIEQLHRRFACEDLKYTVYSQHLLTQDLVNVGCTLSDVNRIIDVLQREGVLRAVNYCINGQNYYWVLEFTGVNENEELKDGEQDT
jgi:transcriptional regulator with XRE-family HTH domain